MCTHIGNLTPKVMEQTFSRPGSDTEIDHRVFPNKEMSEVWKETLFKIIHRAYSTYFHKTPTKDKTKPGCPKCAEEKPNLLHCLWTCPTISKCWDTILEYHRKITGKDINKEPYYCLFNIIPPPSTKDQQKQRTCTSSIPLNSPEGPNAQVDRPTSANLEKDRNGLTQAVPY